MKVTFIIIRQTEKYIGLSATINWCPVAGAYCDARNQFSKNSSMFPMVISWLVGCWSVESWHFYIGLHMSVTHKYFVEA